ncbi:MAG: PDZ domain-containing protein [Planctomycetes bacterium]|nr:PDZ domain-containing protein [Planctomycetota bacterium]
MLALIAILLGGLTFHTRAPVPRDTPPDPTGRGYMGITVGSGSLTISEVMPKTPAEKAGLKTGDAIVRVGTLEPTNFDQVVEHVTSFRPGATVEIEVQRGSERKTFKLKLASRPVELDPQRRYPIEPFPEP